MSIEYVALLAFPSVTVGMEFAEVKVLVAIFRLPIYTGTPTSTEPTLVDITLTKVGTTPVTPDGRELGIFLV
jgi:hypothetical protein